jgi:DNA-binding NtrC family response regulator/tetratricopeptide (TPR) repeat protein
MDGVQPSAGPRTCLIPSDARHTFARSSAQEHRGVRGAGTWNPSRAYEEGMTHVAGGDREAPTPRQKAREALKHGRLAEALTWLKRVRAAPLDDDPAQIALEQADALAGLEAYGEALAVTTHALGRRPGDVDLRARLRIARALALWELGRVSLARNELRKVPADGCQALTRARLEEAWAWLAWREHRAEEARDKIARARATHEQAAYQLGVVRTLAAEGALLRDGGRISEALNVQSRRIDLASATPRLDAVAHARADRGALLIVMGRWGEAREELDRAAALFRNLRDLRENTLAGCTRAVADLATGDLVSARRGVERACELNAQPGASPRALADGLLLLADVHLAAGQPELAEEDCGRALRLSGLTRDRIGECWARLRRSQAILDQGRVRDALVEARRAEAMVPAGRVHIRAWALLAVGRILLRCAPSEAGSVFERVHELADGRPGLADMATIGTLLAHADHLDEAALRVAIGRLEAWGDRQMLSLCFGDIRELLGVVPATDGMEGGVLHSTPAAADSSQSLVDAAVALAASADWTAAVNALRSWAPWHRAVWLGKEAWELRFGEETPRPLPPRDIALDLFAGLNGPSVIRLAEDGPYGRHPTRVLHDLCLAMLVPLEDNGALYLDFRAGSEPADCRVLPALQQLARLIEAHHAAPAPVRVRPPELPGIIGESAAIFDVLHWIKRVAGWHVPVHIFGETGTGKELVARALHQQSQRNTGPFVVVNASSLSEELFESQMFGHVRGSFTSAVASCEGLVAHAEKGTLFIDEVADLSPRVQAKLLRFVQEGEYGRLGDPTTRKADVRIVTATNADLTVRVAAGVFREDLMYRLFDWTITLPPLRERGEDILRLAQHFLREFATEHGRATPALSREVGRLLRQFPWPGNVRQLRAEMQRMLFRAEGRILRPGHLSDEVRGAPTGSCGGLKAARLAFEKEHIAHALEQHGGNRVRTAAALGLSRQSLHSKIRQIGLA